MSFKKTMKSAESLKVVKDKKDFPKGTKFVSEGDIYIVTEEIFSDNTKQRRYVSTTSGDDEIMSLTQLHKDVKDNLITFVEDNNE